MTPDYSAQLFRAMALTVLPWVIPLPLHAQPARSAAATQDGISLQASTTLRGVVQPGNVFQGVVANAGIKTCLGAVRALGPALTGPENSYAVALITHPATPDTSTFSASIERAEPMGTRFVSANFLPTAQGSCDVSYDMVDTWTKSCQDVATQDLKFTHSLSVIGRDINVIVYTPTHHIYLIKTAGGCITINKEVLYR